MTNDEMIAELVMKIADQLAEIEALRRDRAKVWENSGVMRAFRTEARAEALEEAAQACEHLAAMLREKEEYER